MDTLKPFSQSQRIVVKVGSALIVDPQTGRLREKWLTALAKDLSALRAQMKQVTLVSSGAIALGKSRLNQQDKKLSLSEKQACAAAGQSLLTQAYEQVLAPHEIATAQILLTLNDTEDRRRWLNARGTLTALLDLGVIPIINENDTVATDEIRYGDNDRLAARAAQMIGADTLILLSDIDGLYTLDPRSNVAAEHIALVEDITDDIMSMGGSANQASGIGSGGMATKLAAAQIAVQAGCNMCIMDGRNDHPIKRLKNGDKSTWFRASQNPKDARRQWISGHLNLKGKLSIDNGAEKALSSGKSLLAVGVEGLSGEFEKGDAVSIISAQGNEIARGLVSYSSQNAEKILGKNSQEIADILGYDYGLPVVHRDNMVMSK